MELPSVIIPQFLSNETFPDQTSINAIKEFNQILKENNIKSVKEARQCKKLWNMNIGLTLCIQCHNSTKRGGLKCSLAKRKHSLQLK